MQMQMQMQLAANEHNLPTPSRDANDNDNDKTPSKMQQQDTIHNARAHIERTCWETDLGFGGLRLCAREHFQDLDQDILLWDLRNQLPSKPKRQNSGLGFFARRIAALDSDEGGRKAAMSAWYGCACRVLRS
eukprot:1082640-Rhodomonas_salina.1